MISNVSPADPDRCAAIDAAVAMFDDGRFERDLARRVAIATESPDPDRAGELRDYLDVEMRTSLETLDFECEVFANPVGTHCPLMIATRVEDPTLATVLTYGHGDVVRGYDDRWTRGAGPWELSPEGNLWFGRGTADNKGQHTINLLALEAVLETRGSLGFNMVALIETGEECGSAGLSEFCAQHADRLDADVFIASDGPRLDPSRPTVFGGSRGAFNFTMRLDLRDGGHHSGNWGGLLENPGVTLAHALTTMVDRHGNILVDGWQTPPIPDSVTEALSTLAIDPGPGAPAIAPRWGRPGATIAERVFASNTFEILAFETGNPANPVNAIPPSAVAHGHVRFVVGTEPADLLPALRRHLDAHGFQAIDLEASDVAMRATRLEPDNPWMRWAIGSISGTTGQAVDVLPNLGGSLPNDIFADQLGLATVWVPHSYPGCSQHAPDEHLLASTSRQALAIMAGLWHDLGAVDDRHQPATAPN